MPDFELAQGRFEVAAQGCKIPLRRSLPGDEDIVMPIGRVTWNDFGCERFQPTACPVAGHGVADLARGCEADAAAPGRTGRDLKHQARQGYPPFGRLHPEIIRAAAESIDAARRHDGLIRQ